MKRYTLYIIYSIMLLTLAACIDDRYPQIKGTVAEPTFIYNGETGANDVPILPTFANPTYNIVSRSTGVFNSWEDDSTHWMNAPFHTYAFWTGTSNTNYQATSLPQCLLNNDTLKIVDPQGNVKFSQGDSLIFRYWPSDDDNRINKYKYKFFTYFCDSLVPDISKTSNTITAKFTLDGSSDIIHSYAYHTDSLLDVIVETLPFRDDTYEDLKAEGQNMLYTTIAASRDINPLFHLNHTLTRIDIHVQGVETENTDYSFLNVLLDEITLEAPEQVSLKVADDNWTEQTYEAEVEAGTLLTTTGPNVLYNLSIIPDSIHNTEYSDSLRKKRLIDTDYDDIWKQWKEKVLATNEKDTAFFHIADANTEPHPLALPLLVPPMQSYNLVMKGRAMNIAYDDIAGKWSLEKDASGEYFHNIRSDATLELHDANGSPIQFKAGRRYAVTIYVYNSEGGRLKATVADINEEQWIDDNGNDPMIVDNELDEGTH